MSTETKKLFTVAEYYKMAEAGIFANPHRTELINGEVIQMTSMSSRHAAAVGRTTELFAGLFKGKAILRCQLPVRLNDFTEPEPDIALLERRKDSYSESHPGPADVYLIMEISNTSLNYERDVKLPVYAAAKIPEVWILDLSAEALLVFRGPAGSTYQHRLRYGRGKSIYCLSFAHIAVQADDLLGG